MSLFKTTFGKFQKREVHCRERTILHFPTLSRQASAWASGSAPFTPQQRRRITNSTIFNDIRHQTTMPAALEIRVQLQQYLLSWHLNSQGLAKVKRVSDPLNKAVRESLCGNSTDHVDKRGTETTYFTSGSDHHIDSMALGFPEDQEEDGADCSCSRPGFSEDYGSDAESSGAQDVNPFLGEQIREMGISNSCTRQEQMLLRDVAGALCMAEEKAGLLLEKEAQKSSLRRFVMSSLRCAGFNAGVCKTRWEKTNGYPAGDYEFIDVVMEGSRSVGKGDRLLVDIDFKAQFEIARATEEYGALLEVLPLLFVGREDKVRQMIRIMCDAAKRSLKTKGMHIPPWRKARYMLAKWVGPYKRTTKPTSTSPGDGEYAAMDALKSVGMGTDLDASFTQQMEIYFQQAMREAEGKEQLLKGQRDPQPWQPQGKCTLPVATERGIIKSSVREQVKISGLATALAEAARIESNNAQ